MRQKSFEVNIIVSKGTGGGKTAGAITGKPKLTDEEQRDKKRATAAKIARHNLKQMAVGAMWQALHAGVNYTVSGIGMQSGDQFLQARANRAMQTYQMYISAGKGAASGAVTGMAAGAMFGLPGVIIGGVAGAALGTAPTLINRASEVAHARRQQTYNQWKDEMNVNLVRARAELYQTDGRRVR